MNGCVTLVEVLAYVRENPGQNADEINRGMFGRTDNLKQVKRCLCVLRRQTYLEPVYKGNRAYWHATR